MSTPLTIALERDVLAFSQPEDVLNPLSEHIDKLLSEVGENDRAPVGPSEDLSFMSSQAEALLNLPGELHRSLREACERVSHNPSSSLLSALFNAVITPIQATLISFFKAITQTLESIIYDTKKKNEEEFLSIISSLKYHNLVTPNEYIALKSIYKSMNLELLEGQILKLCGQLEMGINGNQHAIQLVRTGNVQSAFCFIHNNLLLREIKAAPNLLNLITEEEGTMLDENNNQTRTKLLQIYNRLNTFKWLKDNLTCSEEELNSSIELLKNSDEVAFTRDLLSFIEKEAKTGLEKRYLMEVSLFLKKCATEPKGLLFQVLSNQYNHDLYLTTWHRKIDALKEHIERVETENSDLQPKAEKLEELFHKALTLYGHTGRIFENEETTISKTFDAAQHGSSVAQWRRINDLFTKISKKPIQKDHHLVCSCLYGTKIHACHLDSKWKSLPERVQALGSLNNKPEENFDLKSKSLLFLTCSFGGGHLAATDALIHYSQIHSNQQEGRYHIRSLNMPLDVLLPVDPIHTMVESLFNIKGFIRSLNLPAEILAVLDVIENTVKEFFDFVNLDWLYNKFMSQDRCNLIDLMRSKGSGPVSQEVIDETKSLIRNSILKENPDIIFLNYAMPAEYVLPVAEELGIPVMHTATDFDLSGFEKLEHIPRHFKSAIASDIPTMIKTIGRNEEYINDHIEVTGPPLRPEFLTKLPPEELLQFRRGLGIGDDEQVILFVSGRQGVPSKIPHKIAAWQNPNKPIRLVVVTGNNKEFASELKKSVVPSIKNKDQIKIDVLGLTQACDMAKLMQTAHIVIGKPGGGIVAEALYSGARFIGDQTGYRLSWEKFNNEIAIEQGLGDKITKIDEVTTKIQEQLALEKGGNFGGNHDIAAKYITIMNQMIHAAEEDMEYVHKRESWAIKV